MVSRVTYTANHQSKHAVFYTQLNDIDMDIHRSRVTLSSHWWVTKDIMTTKRRKPKQKKIAIADNETFISRHQSMQEATHSTDK